MSDCSELLKEIRKLMDKYNIDGYMIPHNDEHSSEYIMKMDERIAFISKFTGSYAFCYISKNEALLWTDGRYFLQAEKELDKGWQLKKLQAGNPSSSHVAFLKSQITEKQKIGYNPSMFTFNLLETISDNKNIIFVPLEIDLVDLLWANKPSDPKNKVIIHEAKFCGETPEDRINKVINQVKKNNCEAIILSKLDEIAWITSLRGGDIEFNPLYKAYFIMDCTKREVKIFAEKEKFSSKEVQDHLKKYQISLFNYDYKEINEAIQKISILKTVVDAGTINVKIMNLLKSNNCLVQNVENLVANIRSTKNNIENEGFRKCHIKDGVGLVKFLAWLENEIMNKKRKDITEYEATKFVYKFRAEGELFMGLSFHSIVGAGPNGAIIHYNPSEKDSRIITGDEVVLIDTGAQYLDGTTDVTRTIHMGNATEYQKEMYTRVLLGNLDLERLKFSSKSNVTGEQVDILARRHLFEIGEDFAHGTGHGVGHFLNVHESPSGISPRVKTILKEGMNTTNEPGFYKENEFGIRIENLLLVKTWNVKPNFLCFENITMAPYCKKLIKWDLLSKKDIDYINQYHQDVWNALSPILKSDEMTLKYLKTACEGYMH